MKAPFAFVVAGRVVVRIGAYVTGATVIRKRRIDAGAYVRVDLDPPDTFLDSLLYDDVNRLLVVYPDDCEVLL